MKTILTSLFMLINSFISQQEINVDALKKDPVLIQYKKVMIEME